jgi:hypothetical protein
MADRKTNDNDAGFPAPMGSLERTIDSDDALVGCPAADEATVEESTDGKEHWELDRMIIRLGGNGF